LEITLGLKHLKGSKREEKGRKKGGKRKQLRDDGGGTKEGQNGENRR
jgi:hypothetical protein